MSINHDQAIFDAIVAATSSTPQGSITINTQAFIAAFNGHRDRKLCTSINPPSDNAAGTRPDSEVEHISADLSARIELYLEDAPSNGGHSDRAGGTCWELLNEAMEELYGAAQKPAHCDICRKAFEPDDDVLLLPSRGNYHQSCYLKRHAQAPSQVPCPFCGCVMVDKEKLRI